ncbi:MAG: MGMT family protein, partial [Planctomycetota bacterium]
GRVTTYGDVAAMADLTRGARRVGRVLSQLPPATNLPWHRVINASGRISLPTDSPGYQTQKERLESEGVAFINGRVSLGRYRWRP